MTIHTVLNSQALQGLKLDLLLTFCGVLVFNVLYLSSASFLRVLCRIKTKLQKNPIEQDIADAIELEQMLPNEVQGTRDK